MCVQIQPQAHARHIAHFAKNNGYFIYCDSKRQNVIIVHCTIYSEIERENRAAMTTEINIKYAVMTAPQTNIVTAMQQCSCRLLERVTMWQ